MTVAKALGLLSPTSAMSTPGVSAIAYPRVRSWPGKLGRMAWRSVQVAVAVAVVVVPFAYAVSGVHHDVLMAAGSGLAVGIGISLRTRERIGLSAGILVGTVVGMVAALLAGLIPGNGIGSLVPPLVALAVGLVDGLGTTHLRGYREVGIEALIMAGLIGIGLFPVIGLMWTIRCFAVAPLTALIAGALTGSPEARRFARPPVLLVLASLAAIAMAMQGIASEDVGTGVPLTEALAGAVVSVATRLIAIPAVVFLAARAGAVWLQPRLQVYQQLAEYLRVMWIPIGGFAVGYVAIIIVFAGFGGMLARFIPEAFVGAEDAGIGEWIAFAFFRALGQDYPGIVPVSAAAWLLVGVQVILAVGWALVVFAAVMSSIQPRLERIARQALSSTSE